MTKTSRQKIAILKNEIRELEVLAERLSQENMSLKRLNRQWQERFAEARSALHGALRSFDGLRG